MENIIPALVGVLGVFIVASIGLFGAIIVAFITTRFQKKQIDQLKKNFEIDREDKYKFAALDKKIETHQKAYVKLHELHGMMYSNDLKGINEIYNWWLGNCLYLEPETRKAMVNSIFDGRYIVNYSLNSANYGSDEVFEERQKKADEKHGNMIKTYGIIEEGVSRNIISKEFMETQNESK